MHLTLEVLGVTNYGIYNLWTGVIVLLSFLQTAMIVSSQRYFSFYRGQGEIEKQKVVFKTNCLLHLVIGILIVFLLETTSLFIFDRFLKIPADRIFYARLCYQTMTIAVLFSIISVPFLAILNARDNKSDNLSDVFVLSALCDKLHKISKRFLFPKFVESEIEAKYTAAHCNLLTFKQMQLAIRALSQGTPALSLVYQGKSDGLCLHYKFPKQLCFDQESLEKVFHELKIYP